MASATPATGVDALKNLFANAPVVTAPTGLVKVQPAKLDLNSMSGADRRMALKEKKKLSVEKKLSKNKPKEKDGERLSRTVFLGGVPLHTMEKHIRAFLELEPSQIEACYFRSVPAADKFVNDKRAASICGEFKTDVKSTKNAYVVLKDASKIDDLVRAKNMKEMDGTPIRVDREHAEKKFSTFDRKRSVYVGGFGAITSEAQVAAQFSKAGEVKGVRLIRDPKTNLCKGFGFVLFADRSTVPKCIQMFHRSEFEGREIDVTKALAEEDLKLAKEQVEMKAHPFGKGIPRNVKDKVLKLRAKRALSYIAREDKKDRLAKSAAAAVESDEVRHRNDSTFRPADQSVRAQKRKAAESKLMTKEISKMAGEAAQARGGEKQQRGRSPASPGERSFSNNKRNGERSFSNNKGSASPGSANKRARSGAPQEQKK